MAWQVRKWHTLPEAGGLLDQPAGLLRKMMVVSNIYDAFSGFHGAHNLAGWAEENQQAWDVIEKVLELRRITDAF